jgi:hypothetical protein
MVMSNFEFYLGQPLVGEDIYLSDPSIGGLRLMHAAFAGHVTAFAGRAHARLRVGVLFRSQKNHTAYRVLFSGGSRPSAMARRRLMGNCREKGQLNVQA